MHDISTFDKRGVPGCALASEAFKPGAMAQAKALGFAPAMIWVPHPIQNRTPEELAELANESVERILECISR